MRGCLGGLRWGRGGPPRLVDRLALSGARVPVRVVHPHGVTFVNAGVHAQAGLFRGPPQERAQLGEIALVSVELVVDDVELVVGPEIADLLIDVVRCDRCHTNTLDTKTPVLVWRRKNTPDYQCFLEANCSQAVRPSSRPRIRDYSGAVGEACALEGKPSWRLPRTCDEPLIHALWHSWEMVEFSGERSGRDVRRILEALPDWFGEQDSIDGYVSDAENTHYESALAMDSGKVVGVSLVRRHFPQAAELHLIAVDPSVRGQGIGRLLVERIATGLAADGCVLLSVHTVGPSYDSPHYAQTREFYYRVGFTPLEEHDGLDWAGPTLILVRPLVSHGRTANVS